MMVNHRTTGWFLLMTGVICGLWGVESNAQQAEIVIPITLNADDLDTRFGTVTAWIDGNGDSTYTDANDTGIVGTLSDGLVGSDVDNVRIADNDSSGTYTDGDDVWIDDGDGVFNDVNDDAITSNIDENTAGLLLLNVKLTRVDSRFVIGFDRTASKFEDDFDIEMPPGTGIDNSPPFGQDSPAQQINSPTATGVGTTVARSTDIRGFTPNQDPVPTVEFNFAIRFGSPPEPLTLRWDNTLFALDGAVLNGTTGFDRAELLIPGEDNIDLASTNSVTVTGAGVKTLTFRFAGGLNSAPVADDDQFSVFGEAAATLDVLANDDDPDGDPMTVSLDTAVTTLGGSITTDGTTITYTAPDSFTPSDPADPDSFDSFQYTITDTAAQGVSKSDVGDVTVRLFSDDVTAVRNHAHTSLSTGDNKGLTVTVTVTYTDAADDPGALTKLELIELMPPGSNFGDDDDYQLTDSADGNAIDGKAVFNLAPGNGITSVDTTIPGQLRFIRDLGASPLPTTTGGSFSFTYHISGGEQDVGVKRIAGNIEYTINTVDQDVDIAPAQSVTSELHPTESEFHAVLSLLSVSPETALVTGEADATAPVQIDVRLGSPPDDNVVVTVTTSETGEAGVQIPVSGELTFTPSNWDQNQTVTVDGLDDNIDDGDVPYTIDFTAASTDTVYDGATGQAQATNTDDDTAGFTLLNANASDIAENGGASTFNVVLDAEPASGDVVLNITSDDTDEFTVTPATLTFTDSNGATPWNTSQLVTIFSVDDNFDRDADTATITVDVKDDASDDAFDAVLSQDVVATAFDDDMAGLTVTPSAILTSENGTTADVFVSLTAEPLADTNVDVVIRGTDPDEATAGTAQLTFTPSGGGTPWNTPQKVTITGADDATADGTRDYDVDFDFDYSGVQGTETVSGQNVDNDLPGLIVSPVAGLETDEDGGQAQFTVRLATNPTADVTIDLTNSEPDEGGLSTTQLTFNPTGGGNPWNVDQTVTITGLDDTTADNVDGDVPYTISLVVSSTDTDYDGKFGTSVGVINRDRDVPAQTVNISFSPTSINFGDIVVDESKTFYVVIASTEAGPVTYDVASDDAAFVVDTPQVEVPAGGTAAVGITYTPTAVGDDGGAVTFTAGAVVTTINVSGAGINAANGGVLSLTPCVVVTKTDAGSIRFDIDLTTQQAFQQFGFSLTYPAELTIDSVSSTLPSGDVNANFGGGELTFEYFSTDTNLPSGTLLTVNGTVTDLTPATYSLSFHSVTNSLFTDVQSIDGQLVVSDDVSVGTIDVDGSEAYSADDLILIFRYETFRSFNLTDGEIEPILVPSTISLGEGITAADVIANIQALGDRVNVDGDVGYDVDDLLLIFRYQTFAGFGLSDGEISPILIPSTMTVGGGVSADDVIANINAILP